jgi:hypothetical protein
MNRDILCRPFDVSQVKTRPGQSGKQIAYVDVAAVIARLNEGCEAWSFEVVSHKVEHEEVIVLAKLTADGVAKMAFGGASITLDKEGRVVSLADDLKASASDALKKCASLFGVALEMYGGASSNGHPAHPDARPTNGPAAERITSRQLAAIQSTCRHRNVTRDELHALIGRRTGKQAVQFLSKSEASEVLTELTGTSGAQ